VYQATPTDLEVGVQCFNDIDPSKCEDWASANIEETRTAISKGWRV